MSGQQSSETAQLRIGELFAGYGGLGMGVQTILGGRIAWFSEFDTGPSKVLAHRFPGVPNHGDITKINWADVEPVDVLTGGSPCQDLSAAGKRAGMTEGTRSNLWVAMREAIAQLRPSLVVWENVRGAFSAAADSAVEPCPGCVGDGSAVSLRALGRVLGDLSDLGYDAGWHGLRAADVGAPHGRFRVFVVAYPSSNPWRVEYGDSAVAADAGRLAREVPAGRGVATVEVAAGDGDPGRAGLMLLPTPAAHEPGGTAERYHARLKAHDGRDSTFLPLSMAVQLLPTPRAGDGEKGGPNQRGSSGDLMLPSAAVQLLPTPTTMDHKASGGNPNTTGTHGTTLTDATARRPQDWGQYTAVIHRWEALTRAAPAPTETGRKGTPQLSPAFSEWMMGLPAGWVTDVPGITRNEALKLCGNGVVPQQAAAAVQTILSRAVAA